MTVAEAIPISSPLSIVRIEIEQLFGMYTYSLSQNAESKNSSNSLFILYGDNGSGKTTVLKLLFHLLSLFRAREHSEFIAQVPFARFEVVLAGGTHLVVTRDDGNLIGSFQIELFDREISISKIKYFDKEKISSKINYGLKEKSKASHLYNKLNVFFLGDDRALQGNIFEIENRSNEQSSYLEFLAETERQRRISRRKVPGLYTANFDRDFALKTSIARTESWIREQALRGSNKGSANVHNLYAKIISRITESGEVISEEKSQQQLIEELKIQEERSKKFSRFGLMSPLDIENFVATLQDSSQATLPIISNVLKPYLDSVSARLDALQDTQDLLTVFVNTVNQFFNDKTVELNVRTGLKIQTQEGKEILPESLSSGEKQLLLLLCNTLTARDKATIFIIDEPEISLNIKWQRQLIRALLDCTKGSSVQFILATHSIELLAQYRSNVVQLKDAIREIANGR